MEVMAFWLVYCLHNSAVWGGDWGGARGVFPDEPLLPASARQDKSCSHLIISKLPWWCIGVVWVGVANLQLVNRCARYLPAWSLINAHDQSDQIYVRLSEKANTVRTTIWQRKNHGMAATPHRSDQQRQAGTGVPMRSKADRKRRLTVVAGRDD